MRGQDAVISIRRKRLKPESVWLYVGPDGCDGGFTRHWAEWGGEPHVWVSDRDCIARLDLRFLVGLLVFVSGQGRAKCEELHQACISAGARRVVTHVTAINRHGEAETVLQMVFFEPGRDQYVWQPEEAAA